MMRTTMSEPHDISDKATRLLEQLLEEEGIDLGGVDISATVIDPNNTADMNSGLLVMAGTNLASYGLNLIHDREGFPEVDKERADLMLSAIDVAIGGIKAVLGYSDIFVFDQKNEQEDDDGMSV